MVNEFRQRAACVWICLFLLANGKARYPSYPAADVGDILQLIRNRIFQPHDIRYNHALGFIIHYDGYSLVYFRRCNYGNNGFLSQKKNFLTPS